MVTLRGVFKDRKEQSVESQGGKEGEEEKWDGEVGKFQAARTGSINELRGERADFTQEQEVDAYDWWQDTLGASRQGGQIIKDPVIQTNDMEI